MIRLRKDLETDKGWVGLPSIGMAQTKYGSRQSLGCGWELLEVWYCWEVKGKTENGRKRAGAGGRRQVLEQLLSPVKNCENVHVQTKKEH